jgi:hypothetical protein
MPVNVPPTHTGTVTDATLDQALTSVVTINTKIYENLFLSATASVQAFDQFQIDFKVRQEDATYLTAAGPTTAGDFTSPTAPLTSASGNLAALSASAGWFLMDVRGIEEVDIKLAFAADNGTYLISYGLQ